MNKKIWIALGAFVLVIALMVGIYFMTRPTAPEATQPSSSQTGEETPEPSQTGAKTIAVTVVHKDKTEKTVTYQTDESFLGPVLVKEGLIPEGNIVDGMFDTVDGEQALWSDNQSWWELFKGDQPAMVGINDMPVNDGDTFRLVFNHG
ncbi:MAG: DUF4430 domain-containing protein [Ruminococcaceae bacterium]|nr:DUF4430 domain-containing protein [Oscillospiraceae bacterium]